MSKASKTDRGGRAARMAGTWKECVKGKKKLKHEGEREVVVVVEEEEEERSCRNGL